MLRITIPGEEYFNEEKNEFFTINDTALELEHSLASLSKWESVWQKPFLGSDTRTSEETLGYVKAMCLDPETPEEVFLRLEQKHFDQISAYIEDKQTATWFSDLHKQSPSREVITSELIYYWMFSLQIPLECENWHLNRLFTLIKVFNAKNSPPKKMSPAEIAARNRELNEQRKAKYGTKG